METTGQNTLMKSAPARPRKILTSAHILIMNESSFLLMVEKDGAFVFL